jgi:hypothetical protein
MDANPPNISRLAFNYRRLVLWFGVQLILSLASGALQARYRQVEPPSSVLLASTVISVGVVGTIVALALYAYRTAEAMGSRVAILWAAALVVPCINALSLLALSSRATAVCRACGVPVGLFGPKVPVESNGSGAPPKPPYPPASAT